MTLSLIQRNKALRASTRTSDLVPLSQEVEVCMYQFARLSP